MPQIKGTHTAIGVCPHCIQITYTVQAFKPVQFCIWCSKSLWFPPNR